MKIQEIFLVLFRRNEMCLTVINFAKSKCVNRHKSRYNILTQVHIITTREKPLIKKSGTKKIKFPC